MTFSTPILASAFVLAAAAALALGSMVVNAGRHSTVRVHSDQHHPANTKTQG